jgi:hypothetical protein
MSVVDLSEYPPDTGAVLAAIAARDARDRQSAVPYTVLAAQTGLDRGAVHERCELLAATDYVETVEWDDEGERLDGYFIDDLRVLEQGRDIAERDQPNR